MHEIWSMQPAVRRARVRTVVRGRELGARFATAVLLLPPVCLAAWYGEPFWPLLLGAAGLVCAAEYYRIVSGRLPA